MVSGRELMNRIRDRAPPPQRAASRCSTHRTIQEGGGAEVESGEETEGQVHVRQTRPELTRAEQTRQEPTRAEQTRPEPTRAEQTRPEPTRVEQTRPEPTRVE